MNLFVYLKKKTGRKCVGNKAASGTEIIQEYGEHQIKTGDGLYIHQLIQSSR